MFARVNAGLVALCTGALIVAFLIGALTALGAKILIFGLVAMISAVLVSTLPDRFIFWGIFAAIFLVVGQLISFANLASALWIPYLLAIPAIARWIVRSSSGWARERVEGLPFYVVALVGLFISLYFLSWALNKSSVISALIVGRQYVVPWLVIPFLASALMVENRPLMLWKFMFWMVVIQLPFVLYQNFYLMGRGYGTWDAMVGSFGGNPMTGGASHTMGIFICYGIATALIFKAYKLISTSLLVLVMVAGLASIALSEVKAMLIFLPITMIYAGLMLSQGSILKILGATALGLLASLAIFAAYLVTFFGQDFNGYASPTQKIELLIQGEESSDPYVNRATGELTRSGALRVWYLENSLSHWPEMIFGQGPGGSRKSGTLGDGDTAKKYPFLLDMTAASMLLWELGVAGLLLYISIFASALLYATYYFVKMPPHQRLERALIASAAVMFLLTGMSIFYTRESLFYPGFQFLIALNFAGMIFANRRRSVGLN